MPSQYQTLKKSIAIGYRASCQSTNKNEKRLIVHHTIPKELESTYLGRHIASASLIQTSTTKYRHHTRSVSTRGVIADEPAVVVSSNMGSNCSHQLCPQRMEHKDFFAESIGTLEPRYHCLILLK